MDESKVSHMIAVDTANFLAMQDELVALRAERSAHAITLATQRKLADLEAENGQLRELLDEAVHVLRPLPADCCDCVQCRVARRIQAVLKE